MNKHLPSSIKHCTEAHTTLFSCSVIVFKECDRPALRKGNTSVRQLTRQSAATSRATLVQAAEEYADHHSLSLVSTRDCTPRFFVDGEPLVVKIRSETSLTRHMVIHSTTTGRWSKS